MSAKKPIKTAKGNYEVGYGKPPKASQFQPGQSGNVGGRPRGRPSFDELLLEEAARLVKFKAGDKVVHMDRDRAVVRKLMDLALQGNMRAMHLIVDRLKQAQALHAVKADPEAPLTEEEIALAKMYPDMAGA
jgi:Family of unknown function (DUF5681)